MQQCVNFALLSASCLPSVENSPLLHVSLFNRSLTACYLGQTANMHRARQGEVL